MGAPTAQVQPSTQPQGKTFGAAASFPQQQQKITFPSQNGQPMMGMPNQYSNTVGLGDNQQQLPQPQVGKGKGA